MLRQLDNSIRNSIDNLSGYSSNKANKSLTLFELGLDDNKSIYLPGQRVDGQLSISLSQDCPVQLLRIRFTGFISTHLFRSESTLVDSPSTATLFKDLQTCIGKRKYLSPGSSDVLERPVMVSAGDYVYPFTFRQAQFI